MAALNSATCLPEEIFRSHKHIHGKGALKKGNSMKVAYLASGVCNPDCLR